MVILILERVTPSLRGELTRWMLEPRTGVFVGNMSGLVRDRLWDKVQDSLKGGAALMVHTARTEQGFRIRSAGDPKRKALDVDGLTLIKVPRKTRPRKGEANDGEEEESTVEVE